MKDGKHGMSPRRALAALALGAVLCLGGLEIAVRVLDLALPLPEEHSDFAPNNVLPRQPPRNVYGRNALGFRGPDRELEKPPGTFRIVGVGDSLTYGSGIRLTGRLRPVPYEATFLARIEAALAARGGPPVEAINLGLPGYGPEPEALMLRHYGLHYRPDLVLVGVSPTDFRGTASGPTGWVGHAYMMSSRARRMGGLGFWLYRRSHVARILFAHPLARAHDRDLLGPGREEDDPETVWARMQEAWGRMADMTRAAGARIVFVRIQNAPRMGHRQGRQGDDPAELLRRLRQVCATRDKCSVTDVLPAFSTHQAPETLCLPNGGRCSEAGFALVADVILRDLESRGLLPDELMPPGGTID